MEWNAMTPEKKKVTIGYILLLVGRFVMAMIGNVMAADPYTLTPAKARLALFFIVGGLVVGLVGVVFVIVGAVKDDIPKKQKAIQILLVIGIFLGGLIGMLCLIGSLFVSRSARKTSNKQDEQDLEKW